MIAINQLGSMNEPRLEGFHRAVEYTGVRTYLCCRWKVSCLYYNVCGYMCDLCMRAYCCSVFRLGSTSQRVSNGDNNVFQGGRAMIRLQISPYPTPATRFFASVIDLLSNNTLDPSTCRGPRYSHSITHAHTHSRVRSGTPLEDCHSLLYPR